jgi:hypothetical protein
MSLAWLLRYGRRFFFFSSTAGVLGQLYTRLPTMFMFHGSMGGMEVSRSMHFHTHCTVDYNTRSIRKVELRWLFSSHVQKAIGYTDSGGHIRSCLNICGRSLGLPSIDCLHELAWLAQPGLTGSWQIGRTVFVDLKGPHLRC